MPEIVQALDLPVVVCPLRTSAALARSLGVAAYLRKPVTREDIRAALRRLPGPIQDALVVDDEPDMVRLLAKMLLAEVRRCHVRRAHSGREAVPMLAEKRPDVVLLDLLMPGSDGYTVLEHMRSDPVLRDVPVVVVSARGVDGDALRARVLEIRRPTGLSVGELMLCVRRDLDVLLSGGTDGTGPAYPGAPVG